MVAMPLPLCPADILVISGADASAFMHGQFTNDVDTLAPGRWHWNAWLDPQGRVRHFFALLHPQPGRWLVWLPLGGGAAMREALVRFVLRAAVRIDDTPDWMLHRLGAGDSPASLAADELHDQDGGLVLRQPAGLAWLAPAANSTPDAEALAAWRLAEARARLPLLAPALTGEFVAQALELDRLGALRFDKGCYPGQEIVARLHFRGGNKRQLRRLAIHGLPPAPGTRLSGAGGRSVGTLLYAASANPQRSEGLGVLAEAGAATGELSAGGCRVELIDGPKPPAPGTPAA